MSLENFSGTLQEGTPSRDPKYETKASGDDLPGWMVNEARLINNALDKGVVTKTQAKAGRGEEGAIFENKEILAVMKGLVEPCLFVEYPPENLSGRDRGEMLTELFKSKFKDKEGREKELGDYLAENRQGVSIAMSTLDDSTAEAIRYLNEKNVPVIAWVVVEDAKGYWTNETNIPETVLKTDAILAWAKEHKLKLNAVGFDSEKPVKLLAGVAQASIVGMAKAINEYRQQVEEARRAGDPQRQFNDLIARLQSEGVKTEMYAFPRGLKRLLGGIGINTPGRVIEMVYTSGILTSLQRPAFGLLKSEDTIPAFGIVSGSPSETPGRDFSRIVEAGKTDKPLAEAQQGPVPKHLSDEDLGILVNEWLNQEINVDDRVFKMRELYLFAMNNARVAMMLSEAIDTAFKKQEKKWEE